MEIPQTVPEPSTGSTEYKFRLVNLSPKQKQHLASQLTWRLAEEHGQAIYKIGLTDDGFPIGLNKWELETSIESLREVVDIADRAVICTISTQTIMHHANSETELVIRCIDSTVDELTKWKYVKDTRLPIHERYIAEVLIRKDIPDYWETKCGIAGNVDSGKSTLLGVLSSGLFDNGRGAARLSVMTLQHEIASGRTSSISQYIIGFDSQGGLVNEKLAKKPHSNGKLDWVDIVRASQKIVTFFDLAGHLKYLPQTVKGLSSNELDYVLIAVGANMSESVSRERSSAQKMGREYKSNNMTREHMDLCIALGIQCIFVITKTDMVSREIKNNTLSGVKRLIRERYTPYMLESIDDVSHCVKLIENGNIIPIVQVSNVTGDGHHILRRLLYYLPSRHTYETGVPPVMQIQDIFHQVEGTSTVIAGSLISGKITAGRAPNGTALKLGPLPDGSFLDARVRSIHCKKADVKEINAGKYACLGLPKAVDGSRLKKGMFAVGASLNPKATWEFIADIMITNTESACIKVGYTPHCFIGHIKQTCKILKIFDPEVESLSAGSEARVLMRFCFRPELIFDHKKLVFKEQKTRGVGTIVKTTDTIHRPLENKNVHKSHKLSRSERRKLREQQQQQQQQQRMVIPTRQLKIDVKENKMNI